MSLNYLTEKNIAINNQNFDGGCLCVCLFASIHVHASRSASLVAKLIMLFSKLID